MLVTVYALSGLAAGVGGLLTAGLIDAGSPTAGDLAELDSIAAVIIGGAAFAGGRGNVGNALVGAFTIGVIRNALNLHNVNAFYQLMAIGVDRAARGRGRRDPRVRREPRPARPGDEARMTPVLAVTRMRRKRFGAVVGLDGVDVEVCAGEVLALLGDNGAGKSTLIKCLSGALRLDRGAIEMDGGRVAIHSPADAQALGIETVYQDLALFDNLTPERQLLRRPRDARRPDWLPRSIRVLKRREMADDDAAHARPAAGRRSTTTARSG